MKVQNSTIVFALFAVFMMVGFGLGIMSERDRYIHMNKPTVDYNLAMDSIYNEIHDLGIPDGDSLFKIILKETDSLTSIPFIENNNLFNLKPHGNQRITTTQCIKGGYIYYISWRSSLLDWVLLHSHYYGFKSDSTYIKNYRR